MHKQHVGLLQDLLSQDKTILPIVSASPTIMKNLLNIVENADIPVIFAQEANLIVKVKKHLHIYRYNI